MSTCISSKGEFDEHVPDEHFVCQRCFVFDEVALRERVVAAEACINLLRKVVDYWDGRPLTHHGDHIYADLCDVLRAITPADSPDPTPNPARAVCRDETTTTAEEAK